MNLSGVVDNTLAQDGNYGISFELRMPTTTWNGDFFFTGGSGNDGLVAEAVGSPLGGGTLYAPALYQGFAVITQNSGHVGILDSLGNIKDVLGDKNNGFGYDPQARNEYGYQQTGTITPIAKSILAAFYGMSPVYSYFLGCSNGGREAMVASQLWGDMFDGIVAGDPGFRLPHAAIAEAWDTQRFANAAEAVTPGSKASGNLVPAATAADLNLVGQLVLAKCDALDGVADGMIFNTAACKQQFDPAMLTTLQCTGHLPASPADYSNSEHVCWPRRFPGKCSLLRLAIRRGNRRPQMDDVDDRRHNEYCGCSCSYNVYRSEHNTGCDLGDVSLLLTTQSFHECFHCVDG